MAVKKKASSPTNGMSKKMMKRKKPINQNYFLDISPLTENQKMFFDEWRKDNPDWDKDWSKGVCGDVAEVGDWRDKMSKTHPGWKDVIGRVGKVDKGFDRRGYQWGE